MPAYTPKTNLIITDPLAPGCAKLLAHPRSFSLASICDLEARFRDGRVNWWLVACIWSGAVPVGDACMRSRARIGYGLATRNVTLASQRCVYLRL